MEESALEKIYKASLKFLVPLTAEETCKIVVEEAIKLVGGDDGMVLLGQKDQLVKAYASSLATKTLQIRKGGYAYTSFRKQKAFIAQTQDANNDVQPSVVKGEVRSVAYIPLSYRNKSIGVLAVRSKENCSFRQKELGALMLYGSMASLGIRKMQLHEETVKALEIRDSFMSMAAHELRTPITTIYGYAQLLESKLKTGNGAEARWVEEMCKESSRLNLLVNDLLEINRIRTGKTHFTWKECSLGEILERSIQNIRFTHPGRQISVENSLNSSHDRVIADYDKLLQAVINILDNACKFSPADSEVAVTLMNIKNALVLTVTDKGLGISRKELPRVFEGFYRGRDPSKDGMGLGLYLSRNIIDEHHGSIQLRSRVNKGTVVEIRLPKAR